MKRKIAIQKGLEEYKKALIEDGHEVVYIGREDHDAEVTIISGIDEAYEEIEPSECHSNGKDSCMLVVDVTDMSIEETLKIVESKKCNCN